MLEINVASVIAGDSNAGEGLPDLSFSLPFSSMTLSDLIARMVENQVSDILD